MKKLLLLLFRCAGVKVASGQITRDTTKQLRIYEDDDFSIYGTGVPIGPGHSLVLLAIMRSCRAVFSDPGTLTLNNCPAVSKHICSIGPLAWIMG